MNGIILRGFLKGAVTDAWNHSDTSREPCSIGSLINTTVSGGGGIAELEGVSSFPSPFPANIAGWYCMWVWLPGCCLCQSGYQPKYLPIGRGGQEGHASVSFSFQLASAHLLNAGGLWN